MARSSALVLCFLMLAALAASLVPAAAEPLDDVRGKSPSESGAWSEPVDTPVQGVHAAMLPTGKVLFYADTTSAHTWDPATGVFTHVPYAARYTLYCSGHAFLPDGRLLIIGGNEEASTWYGPDEVVLFDPYTETWSEAASMNQGRYYPSAITLADGRVLALSGNDEEATPAEVVEVYDAATDTWTVWPDAELEMDMYPRVHVVPGGDVVRVGQERQTLALDPAASSPAWSHIATGSAQRWGSTSVLLPGLDKVLHLGGQSNGFGGEGWQTGPLRDNAVEIAGHVVNGAIEADPGNTAEVLDLATGAWAPTEPMHFPRRDVSAVLLADGSVLALQGGTGYEPLPGWADNTLAPERYDPATNSWELMAQQGLRRGYHHTSLLLPDGRVVVSGGDFEGANPHPELGEHHRHDDPIGFGQTLEVYSPPYLFQGERPTIAQAPSHVSYGGTFAVVTPDAADVESVALVRLGSMTHSVNTDQRYVPLDFTRAGDALVVEEPVDGSVAVPGPYMLVVGVGGVPSVGEQLLIG